MMLVGALAVTLFVLLPNLSWAAEDGAAMYKAKCAVCHGAEGQGKPAAKIPSLVSDDAKKMSNDQLTDAIANGGKDKKASHTFAQKGVTPDQIKALVEQIRSMQK
jgi:mono/diheme cytochrome c family protein